MKVRMIAVGDMVCYPGIDDKSELQTGYILDVKNAGIFLITDDKDFLSGYSALENKDRNDYIQKSLLGQCEEMPKNRVLLASDRRTKIYPGFYRFVKSGKYSTFINTNEELDKFFAKRNGIISISVKIEAKHFFTVIIGGLFQFFIGDVLHYFYICHKLYVKKHEIQKHLQENNHKEDERYHTLLQEQEALKNSKDETRRSFFALIVSIMALLVSIIKKIDK